MFDLREIRDTIGIKYILIIIHVEFFIIANHKKYSLSIQMFRCLCIQTDEKIRIKFLDRKVRNYQRIHLENNVFEILLTYKYNEGRSVIFYQQK